MYQFPDNLYTDIRLETVSRTNITLENLELKQNKTKSDKGAMIRVFDGNRWYYSATTDVENLQQEINNIAKMAVPNPNIHSHPIVKNLEVNQEECFKYQDVDLSQVNAQQKLDLLHTYVPVVKGFDQIKMSRMFYLDKHTVKQIYSSTGTAVTFDTQSCCVSVNYMMQINDIPYHGSEDVYALNFNDLADKQDKIKNTIQTDISYCEAAVPVKQGIYTCVFSPMTTGVFAHESFGHKSEADFMVGDETMKREWAIGTKVGTETLNIIDTGLIEGSGYVPYDDEGCRARKNYLVKDGILAGRLHSGSTAAILEEEPTGNSRAMNFEYEPLVRMTTTYIESGTQTKEELFAGIKEGIYIDNLNHGSGMTTFTIAPRRAYMIRDGKVAEPVRISVITGNVMNTLHEIDGISNEVEYFSFALGGCGKMEQYPLPVAFGGPYIRVNGIQVL
ncbi:MAG: peptidase [Gracilibacter sp. BRH_c7a]|nr:MAG: peptidase [Gracilibacter sp. BRH_c7a]